MPLRVGLGGGLDRVGFHALLVLPEEDQELRKEGSVLFGHHG